MVGVEVIRLRPQIAINLDAHPYRVAVGRLRHVVINQVVGLEHLQRKRHLAVTKGLADHPHKHLTRLGHAARQQPLDVMEAQQPAHITAALVHPPLPLLMHLTVDHLIQPVSAQHLDLTLMPDAMADHVVLDRAHRLLGVVVVAHQLPRTVAQCLEARLDLAVGAGAACYPVSRQPAYPCALVRPPLWLHRLETHRPKQSRA